MRVATTMRDHGQHRTCITMHRTKWRPARRSSRAVRPDRDHQRPGSIPRRGKRVNVCGLDALKSAQRLTTLQDTLPFKTVCAPSPQGSRGKPGACCLQGTANEQACVRACVGSVGRGLQGARAERRDGTQASQGHSERSPAHQERRAMSALTWPAFYLPSRLHLGLGPCFICIYLCFSLFVLS